MMIVLNKKRTAMELAILELAAIEMARVIVEAVSTGGTHDYKKIESLISGIKTPELRSLTWQQVCFLL
ncbi:hypothetical protein KKF23_03255 [Patescibacteria group bacterium]|nr:hypothetical protein [Patescibacteria group bacterium]